MDNVFVIGDVHGNLDRLEGLLRQEGLLDRCEECDGAGMILLEGGMDDKDCLNCDGEGWARKRDDVIVVQLGDLGHFGEGGSPTGDTLTYKYVTRSRWCDVVLWGNHDRALVDEAHAFTGYHPNREAAHYVQMLYNEGRMQLAFEAHGFLITHAGLASAFRQQKVPDDIKNDVVRFVDWINEEDDKYLETGECDRQAWGIRDAISSRRGGSGTVGGILWRDINENLYDGFRQVFGHSVDRKKRQPRYAWKSTTQRLNTKAKRLQRLSPPSYCIDIGGKPGEQGADCLAGIWLPSEKIVTWKKGPVTLPEGITYQDLRES